MIMRDAGTGYEYFLDSLWDRLGGWAGSTGTRSGGGSSTEGAMVRSALRSGILNENQLTDLVFFRRYPERRGRPISLTEPNSGALSQEWRGLRDTLVRPILRGGSRPGPPVVPSPAGLPRPAVIPASRDARAVRVMELLVRQYGYAVNAAAGVVGNLVAESEVQPDRIEGSPSAAPLRGLDFADRMRDFTPEQVRDRDAAAMLGPKFAGIGIAQWTTRSRRDGLFAHTYRGRQLGAGILHDLDAQVDYLVTELRGPYVAVDRILRTPGVSLEDATDEVVYRFEVPASVLQNGSLLPRGDSRVQATFAERRARARQVLDVYRTATGR
jgi:hypothetical protein